MNQTNKRWTGLIVLLFAGSAWAHPGHAGAGLTEGLLHPLMGVDHWLAMVGLGLWSRAAKLPLKAMALVAIGLMVGAFAPLSLPTVEPLLAASVLVAGLMGRLPAWAGLALAGAFSVVHGHAHGQEMGDVGAAFGAIGMSLALMGMGWMAGRSGPVLRAAPALLAVVGTGMLAIG